MKKFIQILLSDSNIYSVKRFVSLICLIMFMAYGISGLFQKFNLEFWIFYISLCIVTIWIGFKFMSAEKILKYGVIERLSKFVKIKDAVDNFIETETEVDTQIQPTFSGDTIDNITIDPPID